MPLFDFKCSCGNGESKDVLLHIRHTKEDYPTCACGNKMDKLFGRVTGIFKGAGFHAVDYRAPTRGF